MTKRDEMNQRLSQVKQKLVMSLAVNAVVPVLLYTVLRNFAVSDLAALAISGAVPAVRTIGLLVWRRRADWIGVVSALSCAVGIAVALLFGGSPLALKIYHSVVTGSIGLVLLISLLIGKPLVLAIANAYAPLQGGRSEAIRKKFAFLTGVAGLVLVVEAAGNILLALALSTGAFLVASKVVKWVIIIAAIGGVRWWMSRRNQATND